MDLARAADFQPFSLSRTAGEHHVHFSARLGEREVARTEANDEVVRFKEALQEVNIDALQVGKTDVFVDPKTFDLVEHRGMRCIGVHAIGSSRSDDLDRRLVLTGITNLHRRGMRS